jgi:hypothetical protein
VLCVACNSTGSQPLDKAYEVFAAFWEKDELDVVDTLMFRWSNIFENNWQLGRDRVTGYWLKHIACCLASNGVRVPPSIVAFLDDGAPCPAHISLELEIRADSMAMWRHQAEVHGDTTQPFWMGGMQVAYREAPPSIDQAWSHWGLGALRLNYVFDLHDPTFRSNFWGDPVHLATGYSVHPTIAGNSCLLCNPIDPESATY